MIALISSLHLFTSDIVNYRGGVYTEIECSSLGRKPRSVISGDRNPSKPNVSFRILTNSTHTKIISMSVRGTGWAANRTSPTKNRNHTRL